MDIYSFMISRDIAEHCRNIGHEFTPLEMAYIVYKSKRAMMEKHKAYKEIIDSAPDMSYSTYAKEHTSLHQVLKDYMEIENKAEIDGTPVSIPLYDNPFWGIQITPPHIFEKGDILTGIGDKPFVLDQLTVKENVSKHNGCEVNKIYGGGYFAKEDGRVIYEHFNNYHHLSYYEGALTGCNRILTAISDHMAGKISYATLLRAYEVIQLDKRMEDICYTDTSAIPDKYIEWVMLD